MHIIKIHVIGMHCNSCKLLLEKSLMTVEHIKTVEANVQKNIVTIGYDTHPTIDDVKNIIRDCGYKVSEKPISRSWFSKDSNDYKIVFGSAL